MPNAQPNTARADLVGFINAVGNVAADKVNPMFKSRYSSLAEITESIKPTLAKYNLTILQTVFSEPGCIGVETSFLHVDGTMFAAGRISVKSEGLNPQQIGSALTYVKKYSLTTACLISTDADDDGAAASKPLTSSPAPSSAPKTGGAGPYASR
jgi:hypothetical protein